MALKVFHRFKNAFVLADDVRSAPPDDIGHFGGAELRAGGVAQSGDAKNPDASALVDDFSPIA